MLIKTLVENKALTADFRAEHGLSLYIETSRHKILFDLGADDLFLENAAKLGVNLAEIDLVIISHGHSDHGGGLATFLEHNQTAPIYLQKGALEQHFAQTADGELHYAGLEQTLAQHPRLRQIEGSLKIDEELEILAQVTGRKYWSGANKTLLDENLQSDTFQHEQNLIIREKGKTVLITGCSHNGIINILERFEQSTHHTADVVIGGFHLYNPALKKSEPPELVATIATELAFRPTIYYTCHCTGAEAFAQLQTQLGDQIHSLSTGEIITI